MESLVNFKDSELPRQQSATAQSLCALNDNLWSGKMAEQLLTFVDTSDSQT